MHSLREDLAGPTELKVHNEMRQICTWFEQVLGHTQRWLII
jgi:hypothetical protein